MFPHRYVLMFPKGYRTGEVLLLEPGERGFEAQVWSLGCAVPGGVSIQLRTELSLANEDIQYVWSLSTSQRTLKRSEEQGRADCFSNQHPL